VDYVFHVALVRDWLARIARLLLFGFQISTLGSNQSVVPKINLCVKWIGDRQRMGRIWQITHLVHGLSIGIAGEAGFI
jgi:hypothetical protein